MARIKRATPEAVQPTTSLVAAGTRLPGTPTATSMTGRSGTAWQEECWRFYDIIGEYRYAVNWVGSILSRATLHATQEKDGRVEKVTTGPAASIIDSLFDGTEGKQQMLKEIGVHFTVAGECYLIGTEQNGVDEWAIVASGEVKKAGGKWKVGRTELPEASIVIRLWRPHPRKNGEADSPSRAVLPILAEIERLTQHVAAQVDSRLASAGILMLPKEITFPGRDADGTPVATADAFMEYLTTAMQTAIRDRDSAAAMVPIVVSVPAEYLGKAEHLKFWSDLDEHAIELRNEAIRRLALGMDMPAEVLTGLGDANHWSAWQVDESAIKAHTEPLLALITSSLAHGYLYPLLAEEVAAEEVRTYGIAADTSEMRLRPNRSKEAFELWDRGELDGDALRRETGFHGDVVPEKDEMQRWIAMQIVSGKTSASPAQVAWALGLLGLPGAPTDEVERDVKPGPSLEDHPTQDPPEQAALMAAAEVLVYRALERAGNRMRSHKVVAKDAAPAADAYLVAGEHHLSLDMLLDDAWTCVERTTAGTGVDPHALARALDSYTRVLLTDRKPHDRNLMANYITLLMA